MHRLACFVSCRKTNNTQAQQRCHKDEFAQGIRAGAASARHSLLFYTRRRTGIAQKLQNLRLALQKGRGLFFFSLEVVAPVPAWSRSKAMLKYLIMLRQESRALGEDRRSRRRQGCNNEVGRKHVASHPGHVATELMIMGKTKQPLC